MGHCSRRPLQMEGAYDPSWSRVIDDDDNDDDDVLFLNVIISCRSNIM